MKNVEPISAPELDGSESWLNKPLSAIRWEEITTEHGKPIVILALREMSYREYLRTEHWHAVRRRTLMRDGYRCFSCKQGGALQAHHVLGYKRRGFERPGDCVSACDKHHTEFHQEWRLS